jgi:hypothetical protein
MRTESVPYQLTTEERLERSRELAQAVADRRQLEEDHAERRGYMRREIQQLDRRIRDLSEVVRAGVEWRDAATLRFDELLRPSEGGDGATA